MSSWWIDRAKNGLVYVLASVFVIAILAFSFYKIFIQRNISNRITNEAGSVNNHYYENAQIKSTFGCQSLGAMRYMKELKEKK